MGRCLYHRYMAISKPIEQLRSSIGEGEAMVSAASLFHALSDPSRLVILQHLQLGEHRVVDLTEHLRLSQSTVSKHLACLRGCGLVDFRTEGRASIYYLKHPDAVVALLSSAENLLSLTGDAVVLCPLHEHGEHTG